MAKKVGRGRPSDGGDLELLNPATFVEFDTVNPKKRGSASGLRYDGYKMARTVGEALQAGAVKADLKYDLSKGYMRLLERPDTPPLPAPGSNARPPKASVLKGTSAGSSHPLSNRRISSPEASSIWYGAGAPDVPEEPALPHRAASSSAAPVPGTTVRGLHSLPELPQATLLERLAARRNAVSSGCTGLPAAPHATQQGLPGLQTGPSPVPWTPSETGSSWRCELLGGPTGSDDRGLAAVRPLAEQWQPRPCFGLQQTVLVPAHTGSGKATDSPNVRNPAANVPPCNFGDEHSDCELLAACRICEDRAQERLQVATSPTRVVAEAAAAGQRFAEEWVREAAEEAAKASKAPVLPASGGTIDSLGVRNGSARAAPGDPDGEFSDGELLAAFHVCQDRVQEGARPAVSSTHDATEAALPGWRDAEEPMRAELEEAAGAEEITLRFRLGTVVVKREPEPEADGVAFGVAGPPEADSGDESDPGADSVTLRFRLGVTTVKQEGPGPGAGALPAAPVSTQLPGDLRQLFQQQQQQQQQQSNQPSGHQRQAAGDAEATDQEQESEEQLQEQFEAAQLASYEQNVAEKQDRRARERELVQQGDTGPLERLDAELMSSLYTTDGMLCWLESAAHRQLLFRYLELQSRATRWYREPAEAYFDSKRRHLATMLEQPDVAVLVTSFLQEETERLEAEMFAMPEKGRYVPHLFAPWALAAGSGSGCVELE